VAHRNQGPVRQLHHYSNGTLLASGHVKNAPWRQCIAVVSFLSPSSDSVSVPVPASASLSQDMSGFTEMSSKISAEELVTLIHAIFTSIDYLAECMGSIWKVETVGDCYIGVVGGPNPCEDHAHRAVVFALSILDNVKRISARTGVPLKMRIGVHSGSITAAFVGQMLPRYLIFGPDVEIVRQMEAAARPGVVGLTDATAKLLPKDWWALPSPAQLYRSVANWYILHDALTSACQYLNLSLSLPPRTKGMLRYTRIEC